MIKVDWFSRPGTASVFTPNDGIAHECKTSSAEISIRIGDSIGITMRWSTSSSRKYPFGRSWVGIMYESNSRFS